VTTVNFSLDMGWMPSEFMERPTAHDIHVL